MKINKYLNLRTNLIHKITLLKINLLKQGIITNKAFEIKLIYYLKKLRPLLFLKNKIKEEACIQQLFLMIQK
jgi:hypothetical protein